MPGVPDKSELIVLINQFSQISHMTAKRPMPQRFSKESPCDTAAGSLGDVYKNTSPGVKTVNERVSSRPQSTVKDSRNVNLKLAILDSDCKIIFER
jgi:hypothetical protein